MKEEENYRFASGTISCVFFIGLFSPSPSLSLTSYTYKQLIFCVTSFIQLCASDVAIVHTLTFDSTQNDFIFFCYFRPEQSMCISSSFFKNKKKKKKIKETKIKQRNL